ncbi:MAG: hypothetical protein JWM05_1319 [Acidimicrobiales bacterium]|nr:hypothetical protein [Acidimicrobiales bacterium]
MAGVAILIVLALDRRVERTPNVAPASRRTRLQGFGEVGVIITSAAGRTREACLLAASTPRQRERGLMTVTDRTLGGYDGMLFAFTSDNAGGFWMRNTPLPLSIAYLDRRGRTVGLRDMAPCRDSPSCPTYRPDAPYRYAVEVPQGGLDRIGLGRGSTLRVAGACPPLAG